jgi:hypothetical protein
MKNILYVLILISSFLIVSCDSDFLEVDSPNLTDQAVWSDPALTQAFILGLYTSVRIVDKEPGHNGEDTPAGFGRGYHWAMWCSVSDETIYSNDDDTYLVQTGQLSPSNYGWMSTTWGRSYRNIREVNLALSNIDTDDSVFEDDLKRLLVAELHFIRAFRYFELLRAFGKVSMMGDHVYSMNDDFTPLYDRKEIPEVVAYILSELEMAIEDLPLDNDARATKGAAMTLKSRLLLYAASPLYTGGSNDGQKWQAAASAANDVINMGKYSLATDLDEDKSENYRKIFVSQNATSEDIFLRYYASTGLGRSIPSERMNGPNGSGGWGGNGPMQNFVDDFEMSNGKAIDEPDSGYDDQDPYEDRDPRFYATVVNNGSMLRDRPYEFFLPGGMDSSDGNEPWNVSKTGYLLRKFMDTEITLDDWDYMGAIPWRYMRYAEILLNYAEAQNEAVGPDDNVYNAINQVRQRAGMPPLVGLSQDQMREKIRNERRIEMAFEEHRYFDVRRWKIAMDVENREARAILIIKEDDGSLTYSPDIALRGKAFEEKHYWMPIPLEEILASNNVLEQNPGY